MQLERLLSQHQEGHLALQAIEPVVNVLGFNRALDLLTDGSAIRTPTP
jgi:hypothetical protein